MAIPRSSLVLALLMPLPAISGTGLVDVGNAFSACLSVEAVHLSFDERFPTLHFALNVNRPISACGCKSAWARFETYTLHEGMVSTLMTGKIRFMSSGDHALPAATDKALLSGRTWGVRFGCAQPD